jgi:hypothetical protein
MAIEIRSRAQEIMDFPTTALNQPWKAWYNVEKSFDVKPLEKPISLGRARQGSLPQQPRQVDLSEIKTSKTK